MINDPASTKERLVAAALEVLREEGFAGASSRAIATRAGVNQALVFYHYGSLDSLLLAALDASSSERMARYRAAVDESATFEDLLRLGREIYREDMASGHITVVTQLVAGSLANPSLSRGVLDRLEEWIAFAEETLAATLGDAVPTRELAHAVVTFFLGANLLTQLAGDDASLDPLLERAVELSPLLSGLLGERPR